MKVRGSEGEKRARPPYRALTVSVGLHLLFALAILSSASGAISGGAPHASFGEAIEVSLAGSEGAPAASELSNSSDKALRELFERVRAEQSDLHAQTDPAERRSDLTSLFQEIQRAHSASAGTDSGKAQAEAKGRTGAGSDRSGTATHAGEATQAPRSGERTRDLSSGDLWAQIEPCWRRLPARSTVPVTVELRLDDKGALALAPRVVRPMAAALNDPRLIAEARAVAAVTACVPTQSAPRTGRTRAFRVLFLPTG
jgi:hypothetical protein